MKEIFGKCHSTKPKFVVESSTSSTCTSKPIKKSRSEKQSPSSRSDYCEKSISCKGNNKRGGGRKKGNIIAKLEQLNGLIFKSIIQRRRHRRRKRRVNVETKNR